MSIRDSTDWATAVRTTDILIRGYGRTSADWEPSLVIQQLTCNPVVCGTAVERFSKQMPIWQPATVAEEGTRPIDVLYGQYDAFARSIIIFINRIIQDSAMFGAEPDELLTLVRIHEHAHAVIHLGCGADEFHRAMSAFGNADKTDWSTFCSDRTSWFSAFPVALHEFLAQALTHAAIQKLSDRRRSETLLGVFDTLEAWQPRYYQLSSKVKDYAAFADWPLVLDAARGVADSYRGQDFTLAEGLEALICAAATQGAPRSGDPTMSVDNSSAPSRSRSVS